MGPGRRRDLGWGRLPLSVRNAEELRGGGAEDLDLVVVGDVGDRQDVVDRSGVPRERVVGAEHHVARPPFRRSGGASPRR